MLFVLQQTFKDETTRSRFVKIHETQQMVLNQFSQECTNFHKPGEQT